MDIRQISRTEFLNACAKAGGGHRGARKGELSLRLESMAVGECIEIKCDNMDEFMRCRNKVAIWKGKCGNDVVSYTSNKKTMTVVVMRCAL